MNEEDKRIPNPNWVEPQDGEIIAAMATRKGVFDGFYDAATQKTVWKKRYFDGHGPPEDPFAIDNQPV